ncbi:helix-turn-helix domain-containing protein [Isachenkonia alkalipeptolytica]|nr:helix-turn-helix domain-containing protein [Isachenkonia alkalipeptolytica]
MDKDHKFRILMEGQKKGVSATCEKHGISRTLYYRWLNRYKSYGIEGLKKQKRNFTPVNKTKPEILSAILSLVKKHPSYGPRELCYLLGDIGYQISESAVYNTLRSHGLSTKQERLRFAKGKKKALLKNDISFKDLASGECWLAWATYYGDFKGIGPVYEYTIFDYKSKIACTRLYSTLASDNFKNLLEALALPVAQSLNMELKFLCFFEEGKDMENFSESFFTDIFTIIRNQGFALDIHLLKQGAYVPEIQQFRKDYTNRCLSFLMPYIKRETSFNGLKIFLQEYVRDYNLHHKQTYQEKDYSPVAYHVHTTDSKMILPLWAYMDRLY